MSTRTNPGPEYLRAEEWGAIRSRRSRMRFALTALAVVAALSGAFFWIRTPSLRAAAELRQAVRKLNEVRNSQIAAFSLEEGPGRTLVWHEWRVGDRSRLEIERTGAVIIHGDGQDLVYDPFTKTARDHIFGKRDIDGRALMIDFLTRAAASPSLERLPEDLVGGRPMQPYRFEQGRERFVLWIDKVTSAPVGCFVEIYTADGWIATHEFAVDLGSAIPAGLLGYVPPADTVRYDLTSPTSRDTDPSRVVARVPYGTRRAIRFGAVEMNKEGVLFVVVHSINVALPYVTDDLGTVYFRDDAARTWPSIPATELVFVPMVRQAFRPTTVKIRFPTEVPVMGGAPVEEIASYEVTFRAPTCSAAPMYRQTTQGAAYDALYEAETVRGFHLSQVRRLPSGRLIDSLAGPRASGDQFAPGEVAQEDRFDAARAYRRALAYYRESGTYSGPTPATVWFRLFELVQSHGEVEDAWRVLLSAEAAIQKDRFEPLAEEIRLSARSWRQRRG